MTISVPGWLFSAILASFSNVSKALDVCKWDALIYVTDKL
jgi:hypothetical protein